MQPGRFKWLAAHHLDRRPEPLAFPRLPQPFIALTCSVDFNSFVHSIHLPPSRRHDLPKCTQRDFKCSNFDVLSINQQGTSSCLCLLILVQFLINTAEIMKENKKGNRESFRKRIPKRFPKRLRGYHEESQSNEPLANVEASTDTATAPLSPPAQPEFILVPSPEQSRQDASQMGLWTRAANSLGPRDREKLENLVRSKFDCPNGHGPDSLADEVNSTLSRAEKLKEENKEVTWRPVSPL